MLPSYIATANLSPTPYLHSEEGPVSRLAHRANGPASRCMTSSHGNLWQVPAAGSWAPGLAWAGNLNTLCIRFPAGLICCNFNSCPCVASVGQHPNVSPALSYICFPLSPLSHSCPDVCRKASTDINRQKKQGLLLGWRQSNAASQLLFGKADPKQLFLPFKR